MKTKELFLTTNSIAIDLINKYEYPYQILPEIKEYIIKLGKNLGKDFIKKEENIWVHKNAIIADSALIKGPCIIDDNAEIRQCAYVRGSVIIGKNCVLGNSCEIKNSIMFDSAKVPHFNYVGDSIIGKNVNMGAGSILSNLKNNGTNIQIKYQNQTIDTGLRKIGAFLGDNVEIGCNCVLNPGTIIGPNTDIYPLTSLRGTIPSNSIVKDSKTIVTKEQR